MALATPGGQREAPGVEQVDEIPRTPERSKLTPQGAASASARAFSPAGCVGETDYAHPSGSDASVHGRTYCNVRVGEVRVITTLQRQRWWGWESLDNRTKVRVAFHTTYDATPHKSCFGQGTYDYRGISDHRSFEGSTYYYAFTKSAVNRTWTC